MSPAAAMAGDEAARAIRDAADTLFYEQGIAGVRMAEIRDAAGVSLRRLYALHPSKRDLVAAWLEDRNGRWMQWFTEAVDRRIGGGVNGVPAVFDAIQE